VRLVQLGGDQRTGGGLQPGHRAPAAEPILIRKRIDTSTPLLAKARVENQQIEGQFKFHRPNPTGDGTTEQFFTVEIKGGRVFSQKLLILNTLDPQQSSEPPLEDVGFVFHTITWTYTQGGVTHEDNWSGKA
jgi:type VI secretion system secreted protein Hcp